ncbi:MAG: hypothetical protein ACRD2G_08675 [Terriglobia bacterium]
MSHPVPHESAIEFHSVHFRINGRELISNLDLEIRCGETLVLRGREFTRHDISGAVPVAIIRDTTSGKGCEIP